jgi:hypothetical protein
MKTKGSRLVVIDASVALSASETDNPVSKSCRDTLICILKICHKMVMTKAIREEWKRHAKRFSWKWRYSMFARKKIKDFEDVDLPDVSIKQSKLTQHDLGVLEKDLLLIKAACAGDGIIITRDEEIIDIWLRYKEHIKTPKTIRWINPIHDNPECLKNL